MKGNVKRLTQREQDLTEQVQILVPRETDRELSKGKLSLFKFLFDKSMKGFRKNYTILSISTKNAVWKRAQVRH